MKGAFFVFLALVAAALGERLCRSNCQSTNNFDDDTNDGCQCDDACVNANDCCDSYFDFCADDIGCVGNCGSDEQLSDADGRCFCDEGCVDADDCCSNYSSECDGATDDTACQGCPDGAQTATSGSTRGSCYCDAECVDSGDCCPSFTKYCGDAIVADDRVLFCDALSTSKSVFCDTGMRKAYYFDIVSNIDTTSLDDSVEFAADTYNRTCLRDPQVVEEDAQTCFNSPTGFNWRFGCSGLNTVWAQHCGDSTSCRDRDCNAPWRRDYWGYSSDVAEAMDPSGNQGYEEFPERFLGSALDGGYPKHSQAGRCLMIYVDECDENGSLPADADRASFFTYGCLDDTYDADEVEFLDWEEALEDSTFLANYGPPPKVYVDAAIRAGNGDSTNSKKFELHNTIEEFSVPLSVIDVLDDTRNTVSC